MSETTQTSDSLKRILVFDRFYENDPEKVDVQYTREHGSDNDSVINSLNHERHEVVGSAKTIAHACELLIALKAGTIEDIHAIVLAGTLEKDHAYSRQPAIYTRPVVETRKKMFGGSKEVTRDRTLHMIPVTDQDGNIFLPETAPGALPSREQYADKERTSSIAAFVLSHVINRLFDEGERPKVILHSSDANMSENDTLPVDAKVEKSYAKDSDSKLAQRIDELTSEV